MTKCKDCESLITKEEYYKKHGTEYINPSDKYYCLFRGLSISERQKQFGFCERTEVTYPVVALRFQKIERDENKP